MQQQSDYFVLFSNNYAFFSPSAQTCASEGFLKASWPNVVVIFVKDEHYRCGVILGPANDDDGLVAAAILLWPFYKRSEKAIYNKRLGRRFQRYGGYYSVF